MIRVKQSIFGGINLFQYIIYISFIYHCTNWIQRIMSIRRNLAPPDAPLFKQLNDAEYYTIAELYPGVDKKWVSDNVTINM
jgi:hypothetical protein